MRTHSLKPFDDGKYLSEEEAMKLLESIPIPKDDPEKAEEQKPKNPETPTLPVTVTNIDDFIVIKNINCVDASGNVFEQYDELYVTKVVVRLANGGHQSFTPYQAIVHFEQQGLFLPSMALSCNIVAALFQAAVEKKGTEYTVKNAELKKVLDQYKNHGAGYGWLAQNTIVDWLNREIIHYPQDIYFPHHCGSNKINQNRLFVGLPIHARIENMALTDALQNAEATRYVRDLTGLKDPAVLVQAGEYFGKTAYIWTSSGSETRAVWLGCNYSYFNLSAGSNLDNSDAVRGVRREGSPVGRAPFK